MSVIFYDKCLEADSYQFDMSSEGVDYVNDVVCYNRRDKYYIAMATNKYNVLEYSYASGNPQDDINAEVSCRYNTCMKCALYMYVCIHVHVVYM